MKRLFVIFALIVANSMFTSCTDVEENNIEKQIELQIQNTGGEEDPVEDEEEDPNPNGGD